jgi:hypothetical protein
MKMIPMTLGILLLGSSGYLASAQEPEDRLTQLEKEVAALRQEQNSLSPAHSVYIGGYGELHYNNLSGDGGASNKDEIDFHRFVLFFGYDFTDRIRFHSELELEHSLSGDGKPGEVELEQAYIDIDINADHTLRGGLFLIPVGILNEKHEPPTFYGVERNGVEKDILPTTWWEAGVGLHGRFTDSTTYAVYLHSGLMTSSNNTYAIRNGRQKVAEAKASDFAGTLAINWSIPGVTLGGTLHYQSDITQGEPEGGAAVLGTIHTDLQKGPFGFRALFAQWELDGDGPKSSGADQQYGWYLEPSYRVSDNIGLFVRYSEWDNIAGTAGANGRKVQYDAGINWWPHHQVVCKADYQWQDNENEKDQSGFNLGIGYNF